MIPQNNSRQTGIRSCTLRSTAIQCACWVVALLHSFFFPISDAGWEEMALVTQTAASGMACLIQAPVVFIIFRRPDLTARVAEVIARAKPSKVFVVADGPRSDRPGEAEECLATRAVIDRIDWPCAVVKNYSDVNLGCGLRVATGLDWAFQQTDRAIVLEDDCLPHPSFFRFCDELLERHRDDARVMHIAGSNFQLGQKRGPFSYYFSWHNNSWGWASWRRAWRFYDLQVKLWPQVRDTSWPLAIVGDPWAAQYWRQQFERAYHMKGAWWTWDYQWTFACWLQNGFSIHPNATLISNIGFGDGATHFTWRESKWANQPLEDLAFPLRHPPFMVRDKTADDFMIRELVLSYLPQKESLPRRAFNTLRSSYVAAVPEPVRMFLRRLRSQP